MKTKLVGLFFLLLCSACGGSKQIAKQSTPSNTAQTPTTVQPHSQTSFTAVEGQNTAYDSAVYEQYRIAKPTKTVIPDRSIDTIIGAPAFKPMEKHGLSDDLPKK